MLPPSYPVLTTLFSLVATSSSYSTTITAAPSSPSSPAFLLEPRGLGYSTTQPTVRTDYEIIYTPFFPTCANDSTVSSIFGPTPPTVIVQPDCDLAIEQACQAVKRETDDSRMTYFTNITSTFDTCQVTIQFPLLALRAPISYDECVAQCQSITESCMLLGVGEYAAVGVQAGIKNMRYVIPDKALVVATNYRLLPGYMIGPPDYFKTPLVMGVDPARVLEPMVGVPSALASAVRKPSRSDVLENVVDTGSDDVNDS